MTGATKLAYRPDLDGLRAIAVALVMADHFGVAGNGGVVGVTLFFVLSGYLITRLLVDERERTGRVQLRAFYVRRFRRLMPALLAVLAFVAVVAVAQHRSPWPDTLPAAAYVGDYWKALGLGTLGMAAHTWSLAVEEQFYLLWPLVMLIAPTRRVLLLALVTFVVFAFAHRPFVSDDWAYFAADSRGDAIAIGCLLALVPFSLPRIVVLASWAIVVGMAAAPQVVPMPFTLVALACAPAVVAGGSALAWAPLVRLGQVSYAMYLWHLPFRDLLDPRGQPPEVAVPRIAVLVTATVGIAFASERWIERPFRVRAAEGRRSRTSGRAVRATGS